MKAALVIMAAGIGSRYGGDKQVDGIGPGGEILMEYSIFDALRAGFTKVVFIIKPELRELIDKLCAKRIAACKTRDGDPVEVCYAYQDFSSIPAFYTIPAERTKPFGTTHAVLCARDVINEPFAVLNADDYYGADAFRVMYDALTSLAPTGEAAMVGYRLDKTVSENGSVTRGVCHVTGEKLDKIVETYQLTPFADGTIRDISSGPQGVVYPNDTVVSMNFWGFMPAIFNEMERYFHDFLRALTPEQLKSECVLPNFIGALTERGELNVRVLHSADRWFGMTYQADKPMVAAELRLLHEQGKYPPTLH